jgi:2-oxoglutarate ferredoxin oxidoreductase subunit beta
MTDVLYEAARHDGTSVVEILENCVIFNDKAHASYTARENREDNQLIVKHGEPMIFGKNQDMGIIMKDRNLYAVKIGVGGIKEKDILIHDQYSQDPGVHRRLGRMMGPDYPIAFGVIRSAPSETYDDKVEEQIEYAKSTSPIKCMDDLLNSGDTWEIE